MANDSGNGKQGSDHSTRSGDHNGGGELQKRLEALGRAILDDVESWEKSTRDSRRSAVEQIGRAVDKAVEQVFDAQKRREEKRERRRRRREEKRQRELDDASMPGGLVMLALAVACVAFAMLRPELWWMVFVALGLGMGGAHQLHLASLRREQQRLGGAKGAPLPSGKGATDAPAQVDEVDALCDELLADLKTSPEAVRSFLQEPEKTVTSLRKTCKALRQRREQLRAEVPTARMDALRSQREELTRRREEATDAEARGKLDEALKSLQAQSDALAQVRANAERVDGEYTELLVLLQEMRTRVSLARSAVSGPQIDGLKQNVQRLNDELAAITEAMESLKRDGGVSAVAPVSDASSVPGEESPGGERRREKVPHGKT